ncbi:HU family DNA-binding protein [Moraxella catarrhalis]|uniref:HU family DNA-binding protein n=1 Tax=Moraxella catarrhalis TaxID=480 RepID=UPI0007E3C316|nr:HU family DNA-binding protein [Moraxella catarrhalis]MPY07395.1 HU family DNA-binding protein [Moraxella catarrhalis]OAV04460.1 DNA-binding protein HU-beta [Moraxella catarrhalis]OAV09561.1 DNA-binding protein HU-beta [Moraxella catarrhalis]OAV23672.1 DNA-binding protein HU-beta [Moraxella catarrhalis]OAV31737.1 DNA-binding protein HU-beta [Moraxella catarrhalis]
MNKQELIQAVAEKSNLTKADAKTAVDTILTVISDTLADGGEINLIGFGSFSVKTQKQRTGRNPKTGEKLTIPAKKVPSFKAGKGLKDAVN